MAKAKNTPSVAALFRNGGSQAVRLPKPFQFAGDRVRIRRVGRGVLLEAMSADPSEWFAALDAFKSEPFMPEGRVQPKMPRKMPRRKIVR
jgi:antitoxin VapB